MGGVFDSKIKSAGRKLYSADGAASSTKLKEILEEVQKDKKNLQRTLHKVWSLTHFLGLKSSMGIKNPWTSQRYFCVDLEPTQGPKVKLLERMEEGNFSYPMRGVINLSFTKNMLFI